jgi:hypothetical protein
MVSCRLRKRSSGEFLDLSLADSTETVAPAGTKATKLHHSEPDPAAPSKAAVVNNKPPAPKLPVDVAIFPLMDVIELTALLGRPGVIDDATVALEACKVITFFLVNLNQDQRGARLQETYAAALQLQHIVKRHSESSVILTMACWGLSRALSNDQLARQTAVMLVPVLGQHPNDARVVRSVLHTIAAALKWSDLGDEVREALLKGGMVHELAAVFARHTCGCPHHTSGCRSNALAARMPVV